MKRQITVFLIVASIQVGHLLAAGKIYWQANGVLITDRDGMVGRSPVPDGRGGAIVFASDGWDSIFAIRIDREGNLPWGLHGRVVDDNAFGGVQGTTEAVSDGHGGAIAVWRRWFPWGHNLYYNRIDSLGNRVWAGNGIPLTLSDSDQVYHQAASDGMGGVVAAWQEQRNGQWDIYAQRVDSNGLRQWGGYGIQVATSVNTAIIAMTKMTHGYVIMCWSDYRTGNWDVYAQKIDMGGNKIWGAYGTPVCTADSGQYVYGHSIINDTVGGCIMAWTDKRSADYDVYAQAMDSLGNARWAANGIKVCNSSSNQWEPVIMESDGQGGGIVAWGDHRNGSFRDIFGQRLSYNGDDQWAENGISFCDAENEQRNPCMLSDGQSGVLISWQDKRSGDYDIYAQRVDSAGNMLWRMNGMPVCSLSGDQQTPLMVLSDSGTAIIIWSDGRSGYWRGYAQRVGDDPSGVAQGDVAELGVPRLKLYGNRPNPFRQKTNIKYQITEPGDVSLKVYNVAGQCVRTLANEVTNSGTHEVTWDGRGDKGEGLAQGVYFCRLGVGERVKTIKMLKVR